MKYTQGQSVQKIVEGGDSLWIYTDDTATVVVTPDNVSANAVTTTVDRTDGVVKYGPYYKPTVINVTATSLDADVRNYEFIANPTTEGEFGEVMAATGGMTPSEIGVALYGAQGYQLDATQYSSHSGSYPTYLDFISSVDDATEGLAVKGNLGLCSDGVNSVYKYTIGNGNRNILIVSGQHAEETLGIISAFEFVKKCLSGGDLQINQIMKHYSITWIPVANPSGWLNIAHSGRLNFNGVNINRNYGQAYWDRYDDTEGTGNDKGASKFSEIETQYVKGVIDEIKPDLTIDCHNLPAGYGASDLYYSSTSSWHGSVGQGVVSMAISNWTDKHSGVVSALGSSYTAKPTLVDFAAPYTIRTLGKNKSASVTIEAKADLDSSSIYFDISANAITKYAGFIAELASATLSYSSGNEFTVSPAWYVVKTNTASGTSLSAGGSLVDSTTPSTILWNKRTPNISATNYDYIEAVVPADGELYIEFNSYMQNTGTSFARVDFKIYVDDVAVDDSVVSTSVDGVNTRVSVATSTRFSATYDGETTLKVSVKAYKVNAGHDDVVLYYPKLTVSFREFNAGLLTPRPI